jgi:nucleoside-diphosphate-sugar epimerase
VRVLVIGAGGFIGSAVTARLAADGHSVVGACQQSELTRELLARYIIEQARQGELDERRLRDGALLHLAQSNLRRQPSDRK